MFVYNSLYHALCYMFFDNITDKGNFYSGNHGVFAHSFIFYWKIPWLLG